MWFWLIVWLDIRKLLWQVVCLSSTWLEPKLENCDVEEWAVGWGWLLFLRNPGWKPQRFRFSRVSNGTYTFKCWERWCYQSKIYHSVFGYFLLPLTLGLRLPVILNKGIIKNEHVQTCGSFDLITTCIVCFVVLECKLRKEKNKRKNKFWCVSRRFKAASFVSPIRLKETTKCPSEWSIIIAHPKNSLVSPVPDKLFFNPLFLFRNVRISRHPQSKRTSSVVSENLGAGRRAMITLFRASY